MHATFRLENGRWPILFRAYFLKNKKKRKNKTNFITCRLIYAWLMAQIVKVNVQLICADKNEKQELISSWLKWCQRPSLGRVSSIPLGFCNFLINLTKHKVLYLISTKGSEFKVKFVNLAVDNFQQSRDMACYKKK